MIKRILSKIKYVVFRKHIFIEGSNDNENWELVTHTKEIINSEIKISNNKKYKYYRIIRNIWES